MEITIVSSREFNQDTSGAKNASRKGPVFIADHGRPAHVLLTIEHYQEMTAGSASLIDLLATPGVEDDEFDPVRAGALYRPADLS